MSVIQRCSFLPCVQTCPLPISSPIPLLSWVLAVSFCSLVRPVTANEPVPGRCLESIRTWVLEHNPELRALDFEAQAAEARIQPAGALPDPTASVGFRGLDRKSTRLNSSH